MVQSSNVFHLDHHLPQIIENITRFRGASTMPIAFCWHTFLSILSSGHLLWVPALCELDSVISVTASVSFMLVDVLSACHLWTPCAPPQDVSHSKSYLWHRQRLYFWQWLQGICARRANYISELLCSLEIMLFRRYAWNCPYHVKLNCCGRSVIVFVWLWALYLCDCIFGICVSGAVYLVCLW